MDDKEFWIDNGYEGFRTLGRLLEKDNWDFREVEIEIEGEWDGEFVYEMTCQGKNGRMSCSAIVVEEQQQLLFYAEAPIMVPEARRLEVAEFITRANFGMRMGNFELDLDDGEVRYKSSFNFKGFFLLPNMIRNCIYPAVTIMDEYLPGLMSVMNGSQSAKEAIAEIEEEQ